MDKLNASWLKARHCVKAVEALGPDHIRFVGGAVRNSLMGLPVCDIDAATDHHPEKVMELLRAKDFNVIPTGIEHGTVTAILDGDILEITTLRQDVETDGRRATVAFTNEWQTDAARRDFTINAIYATIDGELFDPYGGVADIADGRIHFIGSAEDRITEDALRILRLFRFQAHYGRVPLEGGALLAVKKTASQIEGLSVERIAGEFNKLIVAENPVPILKSMQTVGVLERCLGGYPVDIRALDLLIKRGDNYQVKTKALRRLLALMGGHVSDLLRSWNSSNKVQKHARLCSELLAGLGSRSLSLIEWEKLIYRYNHEVVIDCYLISGFGEVDQATLEILQEWDVPIFPVRGDDMIDLGYEPGPELGKIMKDLEKQWIDKDFEPSFDVLIGLLSK